MLEIWYLLCYITSEHGSVFLMEVFLVAKDNKKVVKSNAPKESYFKQVQKELKLVKWPSFKEVLKYTISTIIMCLLLCALFMGLNLLLSIVKGWFL